MILDKTLGEFRVWPLTPVDAAIQRYAVLFFAFASGAFFKPVFKDGDIYKCGEVAEILNTARAEAEKL